MIPLPRSGVRFVEHSPVGAECEVLRGLRSLPCVGRIDGGHQGRECGGGLRAEILFEILLVERFDGRVVRRAGVAGERAEVIAVSAVRQ